MSKFSSDPALQAESHFERLERQATERHLVKLTLGQRVEHWHDDVAEKVGPHIYFDATTEEIQDIADRLHNQQEQYYSGESDYLLYISSRPLDNYRGIESICWSLYQPFLE